MNKPEKKTIMGDVKWMNGYNSACDEWEAYHNETVKELLEACKAVRKLYDELSMSTLESACKYGDQYEPPTKEECLEIRGMIEQAISKAEGK